MKPLKLTIEGIRSFSDRTTINFEEVGKNGIFGIFGNTGSGKSTILDGAIIALYGKLPGIDMAEMISTRSDRAYVELTFSISIGGERKTYAVERSFALKKDRTYRDAKANLYEIAGETTLLVASTTATVNEEIEKIIGLGINEFTKCIVLPQGEFSEFVKATKAERIKIIEKLFDLGRFGEAFNKRLNVSIASLRGAVSENEARKEPFNDATEENVKAAYEEVARLEKVAAEVEKDISETDAALKKSEKIYETENLLAAKRRELAETEKEGEKISLYKSLVIKFPLAQKIAEAENAYAEAAVAFAEAEKGYKEALSARKTREEELSEAKREYDASDEYKALKKTYDERVAALDALSKDRFDADRKEKEINFLLQKYYAAENKGKELLAIKRECEARGKNLDEKIKTLNKLCDVTRALDRVKDGVLKEEYEAQIGYYEARLSAIKKYDDGKEFYREVSGEYAARLSVYEQKLSGAEDADVMGFADEIDRIKGYTEERDKATAEASALSKKSDETANMLTETANETATLKTQGQMLRTELNALTSKIVALVGKKENFDAEYVKAKTASETLEKRISNAEKNYIRRNEEYGEADKAFAVKSGERDRTEKALAAAKERLDGLLKGEVKTVHEAREIVALVGDPTAFNDRITDHEARKMKLGSEIAAAEKELSSSELKGSDYAIFKEKSSLLLKNLTDVRENLGKSKKNALDLSQNSKKRCIIEKEIEKLKERLKTLERLSDAVKDKKFAEFIAAEYLSDVANAARKTLLELTEGKYDIVYSDSLDGKDGFFVLDNLNGGIKRSVASLSGGETFLVSLSLALSLSSEIFSKSMRPMEFFFLDEGFGTLDDELVDTVIDSLEKLRNDNFTIGLISHLQEMKNRIECKILVYGADENNGSSVKTIS
ncbi:MAG: SMC family ATPase [Clostridia bacterium]|nr:SMC family ATPase [Clostridia bacterium]